MKKLKRSMALFIAILMIFGSSFSSFAGTSQLESKPEEEANQEKTEETLESPAEGLTEPALLSQEDPAEDPDEKPAEDPAEEPAEESDEKPAEESDEKPAEESDEKPAEEPDEKPAEEPASKPAAIPVAKPAAIPVAKPAAVPAAKPAEDPVSEPSNDEASQLEEEPVALNLSYAVGSVTIRVFAEAGVLPNDTRLFVEALSYRDSQYYANLVEDREGISLDNFSAFDITLLDSLGNEIQPNGQVRVSFEGLGFIINSNKVAVYHLDSNSVRGAR